MIGSQVMHHKGINTRQARSAHQELEHLPEQTLVRIEAVLKPHVERLYNLIGQDYGWNITSLD